MVAGPVAVYRARARLLRRKLPELAGLVEARTAELQASIAALKQAQDDITRERARLKFIRRAAR